MESDSNNNLKLNQQIFVNRTLNMRSIKVVGFDMDYTLVLYNQLRVEELVFLSAVEYLVDKLGYPKEIKKRVVFDPTKVVRGLVIDKKNGNLIKINRFGYVRTALHGSQFLSRDEVKTKYGNEFIRSNDPRYDLVHTMFSLALGSLFAQLIEYPGLEHGPQNIFDHVDEAIGFVHTQGVLKSTIVAKPEYFIEKNHDYAKTLLMLKTFGKKLALITNSQWDFTQAVMSFSYDSFLKPFKMKWRDLFDIVIVDAAKPNFFSETNRFFEVIPESGFLRNIAGNIELGKIYQGGNSTAVERLFGVESTRILYVGDHLFSDVYESKKKCQWRTMLVVTELEGELVAAAKGAPILKKIRGFMDAKEHLELKIDELRRDQKMGELFKKSEISEKAAQKKEEEINKQISELDAKLSKLVIEHSSFFNPHWGELMWAGNDMSHFGMVLERYACVYTSKVSNLMSYSPVHYFRPKVKMRF